MNTNHPITLRLKAALASAAALMQRSSASRNTSAGVSRKALFSAGVLVFLTACATGPDADPRDPLEPMNRAVFTFNTALDEEVIKPVARRYVEYVPSPIQTAVTNFFGNLREVWSIPNSLLQLKFVDAITSTLRVGLNTVFGFGGLIDLGTAGGMPRHTEDFGQTLGFWGVPPGPYLVLPFLPGTSLRDVVGQYAIDTTYGTAQNYVIDEYVRESWQTNTKLGTTGLGLFNTRARALPITDMAERNALDYYAFTRDAWLQKRRSDVYDGNPPPEDDDDDDAADTKKGKQSKQGDAKTENVAIGSKPETPLSPTLQIDTQYQPRPVILGKR